MHRYAPVLLSFLAGILFSNPVQADPIILADGPGINLPAPTGTVAVDGTPFSGGPFTGAIYMATNGGAITGVGDLTLTVNNASANKVFYATGAGSRITITADTTEIIIHNIPNSTDNNRVFYAQGGGQMELENMTITSNDVGPAMGLTNRALESDGIGSYLKATNMTIHMTGDSQIGAEVFGVAANQAGGVMELFNTDITMVGNNSFGLTNTYGTRLTAENTTVHMTGNSNGVVQANSSTVSLTNFEGTLIGNNSQVFGAFVGSAAGASKNALLEATGATITVKGDYNRFVYASTGATTKLTDSTISGTGINNYGLASRSTSTGANAAPSTITLLNTSVTSLGSGSSAAFVNNGSKLEIGGSKSIIEGQVNGIVITADANVLANGTNLVSLTNQSLLKNLGVGDGEAAFKVGGADANITVTDSTVESGRTLLYVNETQIPLPVAPPGTPPTPGTHSSVVNLTADNSILNGDILVEAGSVADINLVNNSSLQGIINGANDVLVGDHSVWTTPNNSMLVGNLALQSGTLVVNSTAKFASSGQASVVTIGGNFSMNSASTLSLGIGGLNGSQYDHLLVGKNAEVAGTLNVSSLGGFHPANLNLFEIIRSGTTTSGARFATVNDGINNNPNLQRVDIYAPNGVALLYVAVTPPGPTPAPTPPPAPTSSPTPNPRPPINIIVPEPLPPVNPEEPIPLKANRVLAQFLLSFLDPTVEQLTSMFEIPLSGANTQRFNLTDRMTQIQRGSTGFVSAVPPTPAPIPTGKEIWEKEVVPPALVPGPTNRWGVWVNGWGDWVNVNDDNGAKGYDFTTGGVSVGVDYRITDNLAVGIFGAYAHTWTSLNPGSIDVNTGRGGLYATYWNQGFYINGGVYAGGNSYDTSRGELTNTLASGSTSGYEVSTFVGTGYDFHFGNLSLGPVFAAQYTTVHIDGFTEQGSVLPLNIHSDSEESWRTDLGVRASYTWHVGNIIVIPSLWAAWEHEYKYSRLPITFSSPILGGVSATAFGPPEGHDSAIINAGVGTQWTPRISTYVGYQGQLARHNYDAHGVTGTIILSF